MCCRNAPLFAPSLFLPLPGTQAPGTMVDVSEAETQRLKREFVLSDQSQASFVRKPRLDEKRERGQDYFFFHFPLRGRQRPLSSFLLAITGAGRRERARSSEVSPKTLYPTGMD